MKTYSYSEEGVAQYLREICETESPVVRGSMKCMESSGELGGEQEMTYHFETEDGKKYEMICEGHQNVQPHQPLTNRADTIKSITLIDNEED